MVKDDDDYQVNGELESEVDESTTEQAISTAESQSRPALCDDDSDATGHENGVRDAANPLPAIRPAQHQYHGRQGNDDDDAKLDDIYDFELSEDQKQAIQELFNLKLDLGFTAG